MAKLLKSIFGPNEKRKGSDLVEEDKEVSPPLDERRKLSISRSGRMKQANKKRQLIAIDLYGEDFTPQPVEKPKSIQYHVNTPISVPKTSDGNKPVIDAIKHVVTVNKHVFDANKHIVDGNKPVDDANKHVADGNKPVTVANKHVVDGNKPVADGNKHVVDGNKPVDDGNKHIADGNKPVDDENKPLDDANKHVVDENKPVVDANKPVIDANKLGLGSDRKSCVEVKTPEEEIDNAFEIIDNVK